MQGKFEMKICNPTIAYFYKEIWCQLGAKHFLLANISSHVPLVPISTFLDNLHVQYATVNVKKTKLMLSGSKCYRHLVTLHFPLVKTK